MSQVERITHVISKSLTVIEQIGIKFLFVRQLKTDVAETNVMRRVNMSFCQLQITHFPRAHFRGLNYPSDQ